MSQLIDFQLGIGTDNQGRMISDIWQLDHFWLEHDHKYIQWLFPIEVHSRFNHHAPVLSLDDRAQFAQSEQVRQAQQDSLNLMLDFFGMKWSGGEVTPKPELNIRDHIWLKRGGHNHLRISRIIRRLALCGQMELSKQFQAAMLETADLYGEVSQQTQCYWLKANQDI